MKEDGKISSSERFRAAALGVAPWLAFLFIALPAPLYFLFRYFTASEDFAVWMLFALVSLGVGAVAGVAVVVALLIYRRMWLKSLRDKLARDGVTVDELPWFDAELTQAERRTLSGITDALLADAYKETLAARLTASRLTTHARGELVAVERRRQAARKLSGSERPALESALAEDQTRLAKLLDAAQRQQAEAETRLQAIAATARRKQIESGSQIAIERLDAAASPLAIENAKLQRQYEEEIKRELAKRDEPIP